MSFPTAFRSIIVAFISCATLSAEIEVNDFGDARAA